MSANMFTKKVTPDNSRIPVPASPTPIRRQGSLRVRGEKATAMPTFPPPQKRTSLLSNRGANHHPKDPKNQFVNVAGLKRGNSFMERGEKRDSIRHNAVPNRPNHLKTDGGKHLKGGLLTTPQSPARIRSLVSRFLSIHLLY